MRVVVVENHDPVLVGNTTLEVDLSIYRKRVQSLRSHSFQPHADRRRQFHIIGQTGHLLVMDLLVRHGWTILSHELGQGSQPLVLDHPAEFLDNNTGKPLSEEVRKLLSSPKTGIPGLRPTFDMTVAKKDLFAMVEIKSSEKDTMSFNLTLPQYIYYNKAHAVGVPVKLILVKFLDKVYISISRYMGELTQSDLFKLTLYKGGSKPYILKIILNNPYANLTKIASMIPRMPKEIVEAHLAELESAGLIAKEKDEWYCTDKGTMLIRYDKRSAKLKI